MSRAGADTKVSKVLSSVPSSRSTEARNSAGNRYNVGADQSTVDIWERHRKALRPAVAVPDGH